MNGRTENPAACARRKGSNVAPRRGEGGRRGEGTPRLACAQAAAALSASSRRSYSAKAVPLSRRVPLSVTSRHARSFPKRASRSCAAR